MFTLLTAKVFEYEWNLCFCQDFGVMQGSRISILRSAIASTSHLKMTENEMKNLRTDRNLDLQGAVCSIKVSTGPVLMHSYIASENLLIRFLREICRAFILT